MIASATPESFERALALVLADPGIDAALVVYVPPIVTLPLDVAQAIARGAETAAEAAAGRGETPKPVLSCFMGTHGVPEGLRSLHAAHIPSYAFPEPAAIALARAARYGAWRAAPEGRVVRFHDVDAARATAALAAAASRATAGEAAWLRPDEVAEVLGAYGIATVSAAFASSPAEAAAAASRIGPPVAVKLAADTLTHKSELGGVVLDVRSPEEAARAFEAIRARLAERGLAEAMRGVLVQRMVTDGIEAIVGVTQDRAFGPLVMFGLGGTHVELVRDVVFRLQPLTDHDAAEMVRAVRGARLLDGYRGAPPGDVAALEATLLRVSQLLDEHPEVVEMDLNPLAVLPPGRGCVALDARISVEGAR